MKKILLISAFVPSRKTAGQNYTRQLIEDLSGRYEVDLICFRNRSEAEGIAVPDTNMLKCIVVDKKDKLFNALKLPFLHPIFTARFQWSVVRYIRKNKHRYDALIFNFGQVFAYALFAGHSRKIVITHDVMIQKFSRQKNIFGYLENRFVKFSERLLYKTATLIFCHSPKDETLIRNIYGVKAHHISLYFDELLLRTDYKTIVPKDYFVMYGAWGRKENTEGLTWFLDEVFPRTPRLNIKIIGGNMPSDVRRKIDETDRVEYLGFVENPYGYIAEAQGLIAPLFHGAGIKVKVVEALALGTPVLGSAVAWEGIDLYLPLGEHTRIVDTPEEYVRILENRRPVTIADKIRLAQSFRAKNQTKSILNYL